ncbi:MAG: hypothetical protein WC693_01705 [Patescibacteria group bacterium]|jgi:hypothetical protein
MNSLVATAFDQVRDIRCPDGVILTESGQYQCAGCGLNPVNCCCPEMPEVYVIELDGEFDMTGGGYTTDPTWSSARKLRTGLVCLNGVIISSGEPRCVDCELTPYTCCCPNKPIVTIVDFGGHYNMAPAFVPGGHMDI